ncbi:MAG: flavodoxin domain-containing protein [Bacillaceae bacterium]
MATLVVYGSKHGCTKYCSEILRKKLQDDVTVVNLNETLVLDISNYDTIIIGSSIYMGKIQRRVKEFCMNHHSTLLNKRIGFFLCCMFEGEQAYQQLMNVFPKELLDHAVCKEVFGGEFRFQDMNVLEKGIVKMILKKDQKISLPDMKTKVSTLSKKKINTFIRQMNT